MKFTLATRTFTPAAEFTSRCRFCFELDEQVVIRERVHEKPDVRRSKVQNLWKSDAPRELTFSRIESESRATETTCGIRGAPVAAERSPGNLAITCNPINAQDLFKFSLKSLSRAR